MTIVSQLTFNPFKQFISGLFQLNNNYLSYDSDAMFKLDQMLSKINFLNGQYKSKLADFDSLYNNLSSEFDGQEQVFEQLHYELRKNQKEILELRHNNSILKSQLENYQFVQQIIDQCKKDDNFELFQGVNKVLELKKINAHLKLTLKERQKLDDQLSSELKNVQARFEQSQLCESNNKEMVEQLKSQNVQLIQKLTKQNVLLEEQSSQVMQLSQTNSKLEEQFLQKETEILRQSQKLEIANKQQMDQNMQQMQQLSQQISVFSKVQDKQSQQIKDLMQQLAVKDDILLQLKQRIQSNLNFGDDTMIVSSFDLLLQQLQQKSQPQNFVENNPELQDIISQIGDILNLLGQSDEQVLRQVLQRITDSKYLYNNLRQYQQKVEQICQQQDISKVELSQVLVEVRQSLLESASV